MTAELDRSRIAGWSRAGLTDEAVAARRARHGANDVIETVERSWRALLRDTAGDPMLWLLAGTGVLYGFLGERIEAITMLVSIAPLVGMDLFLHRRTQASTAGLARHLATTARVVRGGVAREVAARDLVPGDLTLVAAGEPFPADGIVVDGTALQADESVLTGEAYPVHKRPAAEPLLAGDGPLDDLHWGFAGTRLLTGDAQLLVVLTGGETLYGRIVRSASHGPAERTPLQVAIASLVAALVVAAAVVCVILAGVRLEQGHGWIDALLSAVTLAVAAVPEEFPVVFTFYLGVGVHRLAKRKALVRRAVSVENVGRITCICSDKTGTITEGRLRVGHVDPAPARTDAEVIAAGALASRTESGDPLDLAILRAADLPRPANETLATFPFTEDRRRETAVVRAGDGTLRSATKGSPEVVLRLCELTLAEREAWSGKVEAWAAEGHKVIAVASRPLAAFDGGEPDRGYRFDGLLLCEDPVRRGVADAIDACRRAGVHPIMVTGDHPGTAAAIAGEIGLGDGAPVVVSGPEMEALAARAPAALRRVDVVARAFPMQKLTLVRALQESGEIVAVTGDGVNDVPALSVADVGIAMGGRGTRSAREVAAVVLLDDDFRTIVAAIAEGRALFENLRLAFTYLLVVHLPLVLSAAALPLAGYPLLYLPIHVVWLELLIHPTAMLVFQELPRSSVLAPLDRRPAHFFSRREGAAILGSGLLVSLAVIMGYLWSLRPAEDVEHARAMALVTLTSSSAAVTAMLSGARTRTAHVMIVATLVSTLAIVQTPILARLFHVSPLHLGDWALALTAAGLAGLPLLFRRARAGRGALAPHPPRRNATTARASVAESSGSASEATASLHVSSPSTRRRPS